MPAHHPSEPRESASKVVELTGLVCGAENSAVFFELEGDVAVYEGGANVGAENVYYCTTGGNGRGFRGRGGWGMEEAALRGVLVKKAEMDKRAAY